MRALRSAKQRALRSRSAESIYPRVALAADPVLVKAESFRINVEQLVLGFPELAFAAHALAKDAGVKSPATRIAYPIQHAVGFRRQLLAQTLFEVRSDAAGETQHIKESFGGPAVFRALQQSRNVGRQAGDRRRDANAHLNAGRSQSLHRFEARIRRGRKRLEGPGGSIVGKRDREVESQAGLLRKSLQHINVTSNQSRLGDDTDQIAKLSADFQTATRQLVIRFQRHAWV